MPLAPPRCASSLERTVRHAKLFNARAERYAIVMRLLAVFLASFALACSSSGPPPTFTTVYTTTITNKCSPCHTTATGDGVMFGKLDMTTQANAYANLVNQPAAGVNCSGKGTRVVPGNADQSVMYLKVSLDDPTPCGNKMPDLLPPLSADEAAGIEAWINAGAKND